MLDFMPLNLIIIIVVSVFTIILVSDETLDRAVRRVIDILPFTSRSSLRSVPRATSAS